MLHRDHTDVPALPARSSWSRGADGLVVALVVLAVVAAAGIVRAVALGDDGRDAPRRELAVAVGRYQAALTGHDIAILAPLLGADFTFHNLDFDSIQDRDGFLAWARIIGGAHPDFAVGIDGVQFEADLG